MNRQARLRLAGFFLACLTFLLSPALSQAQAGGFQESFEAAELPGWEFSEGTLVDNGQLVVPPNNFAARFGDWSELILDIRLMVTGPGEFSVHYAFTDNSQYILHFVMDEVWLEKLSGDSSTNLAFSPTANLASGNWVDLQVSFVGGSHQITVEDTLLLEATDPDPLSGGGLLFQAEGERTATIETIQLTTPGAAVAPDENSPPEVPQPEAQAPPPPIPEPDTSQGERAFADLLAGLFNRGSAQVPLSTFVGNLLLAAIFSFILSRVYIHWGSSLSNRRRFAANFMLITITTTFIILVVRSSVALSLGLVGALSIVRFRTAIKEPEELAYLFFAIGLGIGLGDNQRMITLVALAVGILLIGLMRLFRRPQADVNLHLAIADRHPENISLGQIIETVEAHCAKWKLIRYDEGPGNLEAAFLVEFQELAALNRAKTAFSELSDSVEITFLDNRGIE